MISQIIEAMKAFFDNVIFWSIINAGNAAVLLRFGKYKRDLGPGFYFKIPFFDEILDANVMITTEPMGSQTLVSKDNISLVIQSIVKYHISDIKPFMLEVYDARDAITDLCSGSIKHVIVEKTWDEIKANFDEIDNQIAIRARRDIKAFGVSIDKVTITSIAPIQTIRLIQDKDHQPI